MPSEVHIVGGGGGGFGPKPEPEWVDFDVLIPLDSKKIDAEQKVQCTAYPQEKAVGNVRKLVYQSRLGHFQLDCHVLDGSRVVSADSIELEVLSNLISLTKASSSIQ